MTASLHRIGGKLLRYGTSLSGSAPPLRQRIQAKRPGNYVVPASIPLTLQAHGAAVPAGTVVNTWPSFARGHLPAGSHLTISAGGVSQPVQQDSETSYSDGSVWGGRLAFRLPVALAADTPTTFQVTPASGAPDRTPLLTPQALVAAKDITVKSYGQDAGAVTYVTSLREIVTNGPRDDWGVNPIQGWDVPASGPNEVVVRGWRMLHDASQALSTGYHGWVRLWIYLSARVDGTYETFARLEMGNWDVAVANPAVTIGTGVVTRMVMAHEMYDGTQRIEAWGGPNDPRAVSVPAAQLFDMSSNSFLYPPGFYEFQLFSVAPAAGGSLPSELVANSVYGVGLNGYVANSRAESKGDTYPTIDMVNFPNNGTVATFNWNHAYGVVKVEAGRSTLPTGLAEHTLYTLVAVSGGCEFHTISNNSKTPLGPPINFGTVTPGAGVIVVQQRIMFGTTAGMGNIVVTPWVGVWNGTAATLCTPDGLPLHIGTPRVDIGVAWDEDYLSKGAHLFPSYPAPGSPLLTRFPSSANFAPPHDYYPNWPAWTLGFDGTGDNPGDNRIGILNHQQLLSHLVPMDVGYTRLARAQGVSFSDEAMWWLDPRSGRTMALGNGPDEAGALFPRLGPNVLGRAFNGDQDGWVGSQSGYSDGYSQSPFEGSHMMVPWVVPLVQTGSYIYADQAVPQTLTCSMYQDMGQTVLEGSRYWRPYGLHQQVRGSAWLMNCAGFAEIFTPANRPEAALHRHLMDRTCQFYNADLNTSSVQMLTYGGFQPNGGNGDLGFSWDFWVVVISMQVARGERPGWRRVLEAIANPTIGMVNDASPIGGSAYVASSAYHPPMLDGNGQVQTFRSVTHSYYNIDPPYPVVGMRSDSPFTLDGWVKFKTTDYGLFRLISLGWLKSLGIVSMNGDDAGQVYDAMHARMTQAPCTGLQFSTPTDASYTRGQEWWPVWAHQPW